jgi:ATP-dependent exoDNAse (exonuclease V) beta subunit
MSNVDISIYNASAGSGKTFTLTKEYLIKLFKSPQDDAYKRILAITFTNKAVNEMKSRVINALYGFKTTPFLENSLQLLPEIQKENPELTEVFIRSKSKVIIKHLLHEYANFDVLTIDKFTHRLIRSFGQNLDFSENFDVIINQDDILNQAIARVMSQVGEDQLLTQVLLDFAIEKSDDDKSWDVTVDLAQIAKQLTKEAFKKDIDHLNTISLAEYSQIKKDLWQKVLLKQKESADLAKKMLDTFERVGITAEAFNKTGGFFNLIISNLKQPTTNVSVIGQFEKGDFYKKSAPKHQMPALESMVSEMQEVLLKFDENYKKFLLIKDTLKKITPIALLQKINEQMNLIQEEDNSKLLASFNHIIQDEIQKQPALFLYEKLGAKYHHYFIDEFQDTSILQWENLIPLIENTAAGEVTPGKSGTLMVVGDPKQAIYRFRGGDAEQFIQLSDDHFNPFSNPNKKTFFLETNYRSYSEVINFNNDFFKFIANQFSKESYADLYLTKSFQKTNKNLGGYVEIKFINTEEESLELLEDNDDNASSLADDLTNGNIYFDLVLKTIRDLLQKGFQFKDIAVLVQKNEQGNYIAQRLIENSIDIISPDALKLTNSPEVKCVMSLLNYLANPEDKRQKVNFILGLKACKSASIPWSADDQAQLETKDFESLSLYLQENNINLHLENLLNLSLFDMVEKIIRQLFPDQQTNGYLQYFIDLVYEENIKKQVGLYDFLALWDEKSRQFLVPTPKDNNAVQVMTIHKSKGLEFPVVIYPFASLDIGKRGGLDEFFMENPDADIPLPSLLMKATKTMSNFGEDFAKAYEEKAQQVLLDVINIQYVALTRAVEHLYVFSSIKKNKDGSFSGHNFANMLAEFVKTNQCKEDQADLVLTRGENIKFSDQAKAVRPEESLVSLNEIIGDDIIKIAQTEALLWDTKKQSARAFGNILHQIMQEVYVAQDIEKALFKNLSKGVFEPQDYELFKEKIIEIVQQPALKTFYQFDLKILNERALINNVGQVLIPDKIVFHDAKQVSILDYKTGNAQVSHQVQINDYALALEDMGYAVKEKVLVYVGEDLKVVLVD